ncbi:DNA repair protein [Pseudotabrizicola sp. L79]|uniref:DNA repair protein n=1 Tax=Pseudotabrizicola sp. L79 TaxID=3118402 RepID=UPI002F955623
MSVVRGSFLALLVSVLQMVAFWGVVFLAVFLTAFCLMAVLGWVPWPVLPLSLGSSLLPDAGMWALVGLTLFSILLTFFLPANARMARLERSHRSFAMGVEDVARAYRQAHASDRATVFTLSGEFESVRARMEHLRHHPDLAHLEPELLQLAAQMSHETRELARAYSDEKVARARIFLRQRQEEIQALTDRLSIVRHTCDELRRWKQDIDSEERQAQLQLRRLEADLKEILPSLGYDLDWGEDPRDGNVVTLPKPAK